MSLPAINYCPGTLAAGYASYSPTCLRRVFNGKKVSHVLPYVQPQLDEQVADLFIKNRKHISISGVQEKLSLILDKNKLRLTEEGEAGTYILKPIPRDLKLVSQVPANEHLTMQIAQQVYGINTAANALIFFKDGAAAYITKRFDVKPDGSRWGKEDFASLAGKSADNAGPDFKYNYSYEEIGDLIKKYVPAWRVELERFFALVVFNYLFSNGDAHLKNFSLLETPNGDYTLSPAYDLLNTRLHVNDTDFALNKKLFADSYQSGAWHQTGHACGSDFLMLAHRLGIKATRAEKLLAPFITRQEMVQTLTSHSYLSPTSQQGYLLAYNTKRNLLQRV
jgi:serine/threonine-protein kinase HipA